MLKFKSTEMWTIYMCIFLVTNLSQAPHTTHAQGSANDKKTGCFILRSFIELI